MLRPPALDLFTRSWQLKKARRTFNVYTNAFGFHPPLRVIGATGARGKTARQPHLTYPSPVDGTFCQAALECHMAIREHTEVGAGRARQPQAARLTVTAPRGCLGRRSRPSRPHAWCASLKVRRPPACAPRSTADGGGSASALGEDFRGAKLVARRCKFVKCKCRKADPLSARTNAGYRPAAHAALTPLAGGGMHRADHRGCEHAEVLARGVRRGAWRAL